MCLQGSQRKMAWIKTRQGPYSMRGHKKVQLLEFSAVAEISVVSECTQLPAGSGNVSVRLFGEGVDSVT